MRGHRGGAAETGGITGFVSECGSTNKVVVTCRRTGAVA